MYGASKLNRDPPGSSPIAPSRCKRQPLGSLRCPQQPKAQSETGRSIANVTAGGDRSGGGRVAPPQAREGEARAPGCPSPCHGDPRRGTDAGRTEPVRWSSPAATGSRSPTSGSASCSNSKGSVEFRGLGGRGEGPSPRGGRGGAGTRDPEQGRGGVHALRPVRATPRLMNEWAAYLPVSVEARRTVPAAEEASRRGRIRWTTEGWLMTR